MTYKLIYYGFLTAGLLSLVMLMLVQLNKADDKIIYWGLATIIIAQILFITLKLRQLGSEIKTFATILGISFIIATVFIVVLISTVQ